MDYKTKDNPVLENYECEGQMSFSDYDDDEPRSVDTRDSVRTVTDNGVITARNLASLSLKARKLLYIALSQCRRSDKKFYTFEISPTEFAELVGISRQQVYQTADKITDELMGTIIECRKTDKKRFRKYSIFSMCEYDEDSMIRFKLNSDMTDLLLDLKQSFTQPLLQDFMGMKSVYSIEIWHLMQREMQSKKPGSVRLKGEPSTNIEFDLSLQELRTVTGTENKLTKIGHFKEKVLDKAIKDIYDNGLADIEYTNIKRSRKIVGFHFIAKPLTLYDEESYIAQLKQRDPQEYIRYQKRMRKAELYRQRIDKGLTQAEELELESLQEELNTEN